MISRKTELSFGRHKSVYGYCKQVKLQISLQIRFRENLRYLVTQAVVRIPPDFSGPSAAQAYVDSGLKPTSRAKSLPELRLKQCCGYNYLQNYYLLTYRNYIRNYSFLRNYKIM